MIQELAFKNTLKKKKEYTEEQKKQTNNKIK